MSDDERFAGLEDFIDIDEIKRKMKNGEEKLHEISITEWQSSKTFQNVSDFIEEMKKGEDYESLVEEYDELVIENRRLRNRIEEYKK